MASTLLDDGPMVARIRVRRMNGAKRTIEEFFMQRDENVSPPDAADSAASPTTTAVSSTESSTVMREPPTAAARKPAIRWNLIVPIACVVITSALWLDARLQLRRLAASQQQLARDVADLRQMPIIDLTGAPALGSESARVGLIEFSDYECPFCIRHFTATMPQIARDLIETGRIRYVFRDFPIAEIHPGSPRAHEAARCANDQGRFWQMHTRLFSAPGTHTDATLETEARAAGLEPSGFLECLASGRHAGDVKASVAEVVGFGASGTPVFFVGTRDLATNHVEVLHVISGAQPFSAFKDAVDAVAARNAKS
jgi:protein-disulfide isomerase